MLYGIKVEMTKELKEIFGENILDGLEKHTFESKVEAFGEIIDIFNPIVETAHISLHMYHCDTIVVTVYCRDECPEDHFKNNATYELNFKVIELD